MASTSFQAEERKAASRATRALTASFRAKIKSVFDRRSGKLEETNVRSRFRDGGLDRLVVNSPYYSFMNHFGSGKAGNTPTHSRGGANVRSFQRFMGGGLQTRQVQAHSRSGGSVAAHIKGIQYKGHNHIADALQSTNALEQLATDLGENRIVNVVSQIQF